VHGERVLLITTEQAARDSEGPGRGTVLGLDFGGSKIAVALCALDGRILAERVTETEPALGAVANVERAVRLARDLLEETSSLVAVGACTFGIPLDHGVALSPAIPGWSELRLLAHLEEAFGVPVTVVTDVKAAAAAEARRGALVGANPSLYVNLGTGLAVAIVQDGKVMRGAHGASGEIGYNLRNPADLWSSRDGDDPSVVLEGVVSGMGLANSVARLNGTASAADFAPAAADVFERAVADPAYEKVLHDFLQELCYHLVNLTIAVDPERVAVGGGMVRSWGVLEGPIRSALEAHVPYPPELVPGAFPYDAALKGAIDLGLELASAHSQQPPTRQAIR
jgi:glucokinase